ncbi:hypothetical protein FF1_029819 [Malus domestica]
MAPAGKVSEFCRKGIDWLCKSRLPSDITIVVDGVNFHLHKFWRNFLVALTCSLLQLSSAMVVELTPRNVVMVYCAGDYLEMTDEYGEGNLLSKSESFFHKNVLHNWIDSILALQSCEPVIHWAEKLHMVNKCVNAILVTVCADPSLFGWPMMMSCSLQSLGGSILWNGINTGARIRSSESDWWFEVTSFSLTLLCSHLMIHPHGFSSNEDSRVFFFCGSAKDETSCLAGVNSVTESASAWALIEILHR